MRPRLAHILLSAALALPGVASALTVFPPDCTDANGADCYDVVFFSHGLGSARIENGPLDDRGGDTFVLSACRVGRQVVVHSEMLDFYEAAVQAQFLAMTESATTFSMQDVAEQQTQLGRQASVQRFDTRTCLCKLKEEDEG